MTVTVKHTKVSGVADGADATQLQPSDWNADHTLTGFSKLAGLDAMGAGLGLVTQTATDVFTTRTLVAGAGVAITNPAGTAGNITIAVAASTYQPLDATLTGLAALPTAVGLVVQTAVDTFATRQFIQGQGIAITNLAGVAGDITIAINTNAALFWAGQQTMTRPDGNAALQLTSTDASSAAADILNLYRDSSSPAAADNMIAIRFDGNDSVGARLAYARLNTVIVDPTDGSEDSRFDFQTVIAGAFAARWSIGNGLFYAGGGDPGASQISARGFNAFTLATSPSSLDTFGLITSGSYGGGIGMRALTIDFGMWVQSGASNYILFGFGTSGGALTSAATLTAAGTFTASFGMFQDTNASVMVDATSGQAQVGIKGTAGNNRVVYFYTGANRRWGLLTNATAEGGSNVGSDFSINAYSDTDVFLGASVTFNRAAQSAFFASTGAGTDASWINTEAGATGHTNLWQKNSSSPAAADVAVQFQHQGRSSTGALRAYVTLSTQITDPTNAAEDSLFQIATYVTGVLGTRWNVGAGLYYAGAADPGVGNINCLELDIAGTSIFDRANTWTTTQTIVITTSPTWAGRNSTVNGAVDMVCLALSGSGQSSTGVTRAYTQILCRAQTITNGAEDGYMIFRFLRAGASADVMAIRSGVTVGNPVGGDKGIGTLNAVGVYDDNVLLTCYVVEAANNHGRIDLARWDHLNYDRPHAPARKFATRTEMLDVDKYIAEWKETGVLPGLPDPEAWAEAGGMSTGDMIQRLWETVELLAVHIDQVNTRALAA